MSILDCCRIKLNSTWKVLWQLTIVLHKRQDFPRQTQICHVFLSFCLFGTGTSICLPIYPVIHIVTCLPTSLSISISNFNFPKPPVLSCETRFTSVVLMFAHCAVQLNDLPHITRRTRVSRCWWAPQTAPQLLPDSADSWIGVDSTQPHYWGCTGASVTLSSLRVACLWHSTGLNHMKLLGFECQKQPNSSYGSTQ